MPDYDAIIRQAHYVSPSGVTIVMQFDDIERSSGKKFAVHELPQQDIPIVQDQGNTARRYPFACYFTGDNAYTDADALHAALSEIGPGTFEHPMFGNLDVLATTWAESRKLVEGLGRVDFSIEFVQAPKIKPLSTTTPISEAEGITQSTGDATTASATDSAAKFDPDNAADKAKTKNNVLSSVASFSRNVRNISSGISEVSTEIKRQARVITNTIDDLLGAPLELFNALKTLYDTPAYIESSIERKIDSYLSQAEAIGIIHPTSRSQATALVENMLYVIASAANASTVGELSSRSNAIMAADSLGSIGETVIQYIEDAEAAVPGYFPNTDILAALIDALSKARASLIDRAFSLRTERRITLDVETTPLNLIAQFIGTSPEDVPDLDTAVDEVIGTNHLKGDAISLVPAGFEWIYYA